MATGISIHIGLNELDQKHYQGLFTLAGCLNDAEAMRGMAQAAGFEPQVLLGPDATAGAVLEAIDGAAARVGDDGILLITYSGHGGRVRDLSDDELGDGWDETWCLYDRELVDDELYAAWARFPKGARVVVVSDSCYSGDMIREANRPNAPSAPTKRPPWRPQPVMEALEAIDALDDRSFLDRPQSGAADRRVTRGELPRFRALGPRVSKRVYCRNQPTYDAIQKEAHAGPRPSIEAEVLLLSAAADHETAEDGEKNGAFTAALLEMWNGGRFDGSYVELHTALFRRLVPRQHPVLTALRPPSFARQRAFSI